MSPLYWKYRGAVHNIYNLRYKTPKEILVRFRNGSTYDYHFIIKELAKESHCQFERLGESTETFSMQIKKKLDNDKTITYKLDFIDSFRFMSIPLSNLVNNLEDLKNNMNNLEDYIIMSVKTVNHTVIT